MAPKVHWTQQEEQYLREIREDMNIKSWSQISKLICQKFVDKHYTGKQCRERYVNHIKFSKETIDPEWDQSDYLTMLKMVSQNGTKWKINAQMMPGRSQNSIKNKFYGIIRKLIRHLNTVGKKQIKKYSKPIKYDSIIRILEAADVTWQLYPIIKADSEKLRSQILDSLSHFSPQEVPDSKWLQLINSIHQFNFLTRSYNLKKTKNFCQRLSNQLGKTRKLSLAGTKEPITPQNMSSLSNQSQIEPVSLDEKNIDETHIHKMKSMNSVIAQIVNFMNDCPYSLKFEQFPDDYFRDDENLGALLGDKYLRSSGTLSFFF